MRSAFLRTYTIVSGDNRICRFQHGRNGRQAVAYYAFRAANPFLTALFRRHVAGRSEVIGAPGALSIWFVADGVLIGRSAIPGAPRDRRCAPTAPLRRRRHPFARRGRRASSWLRGRSDWL